MIARRFPCRLKIDSPRAVDMLYQYERGSLFMDPQTDALIDIAEFQVGYFGGPGKMLLPSPAKGSAE